MTWEITRTASGIKKAQVVNGCGASRQPLGNVIIN